MFGRDHLKPICTTPQLDVVLGPPLSQFLVSSTRNLELVMNEDLYVVTINYIYIIYSILYLYIQYIYICINSQLSRGDHYFSKQ